MHHKDKTVASERQTVIRGTAYTERLFTDGSAELVRYDTHGRIWVFLCFPNTDNPARMGKIKEAVKYNFDPTA
jgi:hypothetical protein